MLFVGRGDAANDGTFFILHPLVKSYVQMEMERKNGQGLQVQLFEANDFGECTYLLFREGGSGILIDAGFLYDEEWRHFTDFIAEHNVTLTLLLTMWLVWLKPCQSGIYLLLCTLPTPAY